MTALRVVHVSDVYLPRLGGLEVQVHDLAAQQVLAGHDVTVVTATAADGDDDLVVHRTGRVVGGRWGDVLQPAVDGVHCHVSLVSPLAWSAARVATRRGLPVTVTMHSVLATSGPVAALWRGVARALGPVSWTAVSRVAADALSQVVDAPVQVLPNGIDPAQWRPGRPGTSPVPTVVAVMRLTRRKRAVELVDVLADVVRRSEGAPVRAVIAGDGPARGDVERAVRAHRLQDRVVLAGRLARPQVAALLASADVFVAPAHLESFGIAALEARCAGLPVVAMRHGGVGDFVVDGRDGYLVGDDHELAARISALVVDRPRLRRLGEGLRARPVPLAWPEVVERCDRAYATAAARRGSPGHAPAALSG